MSREILPPHLNFTSYDLNITPDLEQFTYKCKETIVFFVSSETDEITLNGKDFNIDHVTVVYDGEIYTPTEINRYSPETVTLSLPIVLIPKIGMYGIINLELSGTINDQLCGFYRTAYTSVDGQKKYAGTTQFESHDARRAFLCADEPGRKATFAVTLNVPKDLQALSNTPIQKESQCTWNSALKTVQFNQTPLMSTYLLAWYIGELEFVETTCKLPKTDKPLTIRTYTTPGKKDQATFANDFGAKVIAYFSEYFDIDYPLEKLDQIGVPDFAAGAMENWGLVTYRETALLTSSTTSVGTKMRVAETIAHELAHQWFGNLVTPEWWNELWLKEGFATYIAWMALDKFYPEWKCWDYFVANVFEQALALDELDSSHPINNDVKFVSDIDEIFDTISYLKGASMLRMLAAWLGEKDFQKGLVEYLKMFKYQNTTSEDLWNHLSTASGKNVAEVMDSWINQQGFPLVTVSKNRFNQYLFSQEPYGGDQTDLRLWKIPLNMNWLLPEPQLLSEMILEEPWSCIKIDDGQELVKANIGRTGFYRMRYHPSMDQTLKAYIDQKKLSAVDRGEIFSGMFDLAKRGYDVTTRALGFLSSYEDESEYIVWSEIVSRLNSLKFVSTGSDCGPQIKAKIESFYKKCLTPHLVKLGWDFSQNDTYEMTKFRQLVISTLAGIGEPTVLETCRNCFADFVKTVNESADGTGVADFSSLNPNIRLSVFVAVIRFSETGEEFEALKDLYSKVTDPAVRVEILKALGSTPDGLLLGQALDFSFKSGQVRIQDMDYVLLSLYPGNSILAWKYITGNWIKILSVFGNGGMGLLHGLVCFPLDGLLLPDEIKCAKDFLAEQEADVKTIRNSIKQEFEQTQKLLEWFNRDRERLIEWSAPDGSPDGSE